MPLTKALLQSSISVALNVSFLAGDQTLTAPAGDGARRFSICAMRA